MKFNIDIESYRSRFLGGNARAYLFFVQIQFPGMGNVLQSGLQGAMAGGIPTSIGSLLPGAMSAASSGIDLIGLKTGTEDFGYFVKSTNLPESSIQEASTFWCGQEYKIASTRRFVEWTVTFYVDQQAKLLKKFWDWHKIIHNPETNAYGKPVTYMSDQLLYLIGLDGDSEISCYKLFGAWPKQIGQVALDYQTNDFAQFDITFAYQYHTVSEKEPSALGGIAKRAIGGLTQSIL
jgi:hypothetical protein